MVIEKCIDEGMAKRIDRLIGQIWEKEKLLKN